MYGTYPVSILYKSTAGRYRPVSYPDGPITARCRFIKNASWVQYNLNGSNTDGSFTMNDSNSCLSPSEMLSIAQENKYQGIF